MIKTLMTEPSDVLLRDDFASLRGDSYLVFEGARRRTVAPRWAVQGSNVPAAGRRLATMSAPISKTTVFVMYNPGFRHWSPPV